ncbi:MAG: hypothetical protein IAF08_07650 [Rhizobacter sp.]|nr:hypothetical protein [Chlorobiales bacterium]
MKFLRLSLLLLAFATALTLSACNSNSPSGNDYVAPAYPANQNTTWWYNQFSDTSASGSGKYAQTSTRSEVLYKKDSVIAGKSAILVRGTTTFTVGGTTNDTVRYAVENSSDVQIYLNSITDLIGNVAGVEFLSGSLTGWQPYLKPSVGIGATYPVITSVPVSARINTNPTGTPVYVDATITTTINGKVDGKESITVGGKTYDTVKLTLSISLTISVSGFPFPVAVPAINAGFWVADRVGIVKQDTPSTTVTIPLFPSIVIAGTKKELVSITGN